MSEDNEKVFDPIEEIKDIAELRMALGGAQDLEATELHGAYKTPAYISYEAARKLRKEIEEKLDKAEGKFRTGCEAVFEETEEKAFPGGKIKMFTGYEYDPEEAVKWAAKLAVEKEEFFELLKLDAKKFKAQCKGVTPPFVTKTETGKMRIDTDLASFLEGGGDG